MSLLLIIYLSHRGPRGGSHKEERREMMTSALGASVGDSARYIPVLSTSLLPSSWTTPYFHPRAFSIATPGCVSLARMRLQPQSRLPPSIAIRTITPPILEAVHNAVNRSVLACSATSFPTGYSSLCDPFKRTRLSVANSVAKWTTSWPTRAVTSRDSPSPSSSYK